MSKRLKWRVVEEDFNGDDDDYHLLTTSEAQALTSFEDFVFRATCGSPSGPTLAARLRELGYDPDTLRLSVKRSKR